MLGLRLAIIFTILLLTVGWFMNVYALLKSDLKEPYAPEVIRALGVLISPVGGVAGYLTLEGEDAQPE